MKILNPSNDILERDLFKKIEMVFPIKHLMAPTTISAIIKNDL